MKRPYACITVRDLPSFDTLRAVNGACKMVPGARMGHSRCHHSVAVARNMGVACALSGGHTHILFVDNDTTIPPNTLKDMLELGAPIVTGCTPTTANGADKFETFVNVASSSNPDGSPLWHKRWFKGNRKVEWCGASCLLIDMEVFKAVPFPWFRTGETWDGSHYVYRSEDLEFCEAARKQGYEIVAMGDIRCGHKREVDCTDLIGEEEEQVYGSHLKVLEQLGEKYAIKRVTEYGCGYYSTPAFLRFPLLESLLSIESNQEYMRTVQENLNDSRLSMKLCSPENMVHQEVNNPELVFVDCEDYGVRSSLIEKWSGNGTILAVHDTDIEEVMSAINKSKFKHKKILGNTGLLSNKTDFSSITGD